MRERFENRINEFVCPSDRGEFFFLRKIRTVLPYMQEQNGQEKQEKEPL